MARVWDEKLEGTGYEETWDAGETVGSGNTLDEDFATSSVTGAPADWNVQCLRSINGAVASDAYVRDGSLSITTAFYTRLEIIVEVMPTGGNQRFCRWTNGASAQIMFIDLTTAGTLQMRSYHDGSVHSYNSFVNLSLDTRYRVETKWDFSNNLWAWRLDGVDQRNDQDSSSPVTSEGLLTSTHETTWTTQRIGAQNNSREATLNIDNIAVDNADWVGAESSAVSNTLKRDRRGPYPSLYTM